MRKIIISGFVSVLLLGLGMSVQAKVKQAKFFVFGIATSFGDSTVYFTDIQVLDSAKLTGKSDFLAGRSEYSNQLRNYLAIQGKDHRTCAVSYAKNQKNAQKKYDKILNRYIKGRKLSGKYNIKHIDTDEFRFHNVTVTESIQEEQKQKTSSSKKKR